MFLEQKDMNLVELITSFGVGLVVKVIQVNLASTSPFKMI
jgi:hypothetical protein